MHLPAFPFLSADDFNQLCHAFLAQQQHLCSFSALSTPPPQWALAHESTYGSWLSLRRRVAVHSAACLPSTGPAVESGDLIEEEDPESLPPRQEHGENNVQVEYNILYSPAYRLPVLYFTPLQPLDSEALFSLLLGASGSDRTWDGTVTQGENPRNGEAWWFVHPCQTGEAMAEWREVLVGSGTEREAGEKGAQYLAIWLGIVGSVAGMRG